MAGKRRCLLVDWPGLLDCQCLAANQRWWRRPPEFDWRSQHRSSDCSAVVQYLCLRASAAVHSGQLGTGTMHGPLLRPLDLAFSKSLRMREKQTVQICVESYNLTNTASFQPPTGTSARRHLAAFRPRAMQFRGKCSLASSTCSDTKSRVAAWQEFERTTFDISGSRE
jgi:hypothetical protein